MRSAPLGQLGSLQQLKKDGRAFINTAPFNSALAYEFKLPVGGVIWGRDNCITNSASLEDFVEAMGVLRPLEPGPVNIP
jgi:hypothetical protein